jgi:hypothetical protein
VSESDIEWIKQFKRSLIELDDRIQSGLTGDVDIEQAGEILLELNAIKAQVSYIYSEALEQTGRIMDEVESVSLANGAVIEKRWSKDRKGWRHKDLIEVVADRIDQMSIDLDTGERTLSPREMMSKVLDFVQPSYWRISALDKIGVSADEFCESGESKASIVLRKPKENK